MSNNKYIDLLKNIKEAKNKNMPFLHKNFFNDEEIPRWQEILDCLYDQYNEKQNVITEYDSYLSIIPDYFEQDRYFLQMKEFKETFKFSCHGPKVSIGPFDIQSHKDSWDGITIHCEGNNTWTVSDKPVSNNPSYLESFDLERGDLLFCPRGLYHKIKSSNARASILFVGDIK